MYELRLAAGAQHASDSHGAGTRELVVVVSGSRPTAGDRTEILEGGDSMLFNSNVPHVYENPGGTEARYHDPIMYPSRWSDARVSPADQLGRGASRR